MPKGFARVAAVSLPVHLGDVAANEQEILSAMEPLRRQGVQLAVFPELCLTGYTLGDLLLQPLVQAASWAARIAENGQFHGCGHRSAGEHAQPPVQLRCRALWRTAHRLCAQDLSAQRQ